MTGTTPEQRVEEPSALDQARVITDKREPFEVYLDMARLNLQRRSVLEYPGLEGPDLKSLVDANFYAVAYDAYLADLGGFAETEEGILSMLEEYHEGQDD